MSLCDIALCILEETCIDFDLKYEYSMGWKMSYIGLIIQYMIWELVIALEQPKILCCQQNGIKNDVKFVMRYTNTELNLCDCMLTNLSHDVVEILCATTECNGEQGTLEECKEKKGNMSAIIEFVVKATVRLKLETVHLSISALVWSNNERIATLRGLFLAWYLRL